MISLPSNYIFDTNIFDKILDNQIDINELPKNSKYFVTHIQKDQIEAIEKPEKQEKKAALLTIFNNIPQIKIPTESGVYGISKYGECRYAAEDDNLLDEFSRGNNSHIEDALIGETAIKNNLILVTNDKDFRNSDVALVYKYWELFQVDDFNDGDIDKKHMFKLERYTSLTRARAKIQNEFKLFQAAENNLKKQNICIEFLWCLPCLNLKK